eukprot:scaffold256776_cov28-Tisochrysis_lutea.AAC.1
MEIEAFIPMVLQNPDAATGKSRLKRVALIGDHHQLPPVVKNLAFQKWAGSIVPKRPSVGDACDWDHIARTTMRSPTLEPPAAPSLKPRFYSS